MTMSSSHICNSNKDCNIADELLLTKTDGLPNYRQEMIDLFREGMDISPKKDGSLLKTLKKPGHSMTCPLFGDKVYLKFVMYLEDGRTLDSWMDDSQPYTFTIGDAEVILAWEFGIPTMNEGEFSMFRCLPGLAYGSEGRPPLVPPDAILVFQVELLRWHGKDISDAGDGSIYTSLLSAGETYGMPNEGAQCKVEIIGRHKRRIFEEREVSFQLGEGSQVGIVAGVEQALLRFSRKEKSRLKVKSHMAYGTLGCQELGIPPGADLEYDVHLLDCTRAKDFWDMTPDEKLDQSRKDKQKALHYFERGNVFMAKKFFGKVAEYLQFEELSSDCDASERKNLLTTSHMNLALCHLKENNPHEAFLACSKALELDSKNEKCRFRRATASMKMKDFKSAVDDLIQVVDLNPNNRTAKRELEASRKRLKEFAARERQLYRRMFD